MRMVKGGIYVLDDVDGYTSEFESNHKMVKTLRKPFKVSHINNLGVMEIQTVSGEAIKNPRTMKLIIGNSEMKYFIECPVSFDIGSKYRLARRAEFVAEGGIMNKMIMNRYLSDHFRVDQLDANGNVAALTTYNKDGNVIVQRIFTENFIKRFVMCCERWMFEEIKPIDTRSQTGVDIESKIAYHSELKKRYRELSAQRDQIDNAMKKMKDEIDQLKFDINSDYGKLGALVDEMLGDE